MKFALLYFLSISVVAFTQNLPEAMENQCRSEAKEIALKSYESCITVKKTSQIENLRQEYQTRLLELKNEYDQKIKDLATTTTSELTEPTNQKSQSEATLKTKPSQNSKSKATAKKGASSTSLNQSEPTIKLKKAKTIAKTKRKSIPAEPTLMTEIPSTQQQSIEDEVTTAKSIEVELNSVTGDVEKLDVQEMNQ